MYRSDLNAYTRGGIFEVVLVASRATPTRGVQGVLFSHPLLSNLRPLPSHLPPPSPPTSPHHPTTSRPLSSHPSPAPSLPPYRPPVPHLSYMYNVHVTGQIWEPCWKSCVCCTCTCKFLKYRSNTEISNTCTCIFMYSDYVTHILEVNSPLPLVIK
jgi:hypothetical protein